MAKRRSKYSGSIPTATDHHKQNLTWALVAILVCSGITAGAVVYICDFILNSFQDSHAMVGLITDSGLVFDDKNLEGNLSVATTGLHLAKDFGLALVIGVVGVGVAVFIRIRRQKAS